MAGSLQRGSLRVGLLSTSSEIRKVLKSVAADLEDSGFMSAYEGSPNLLYGSPKEETLHVRYGGAWEADVNEAVSKVLKALNKSSSPVEMNKCWSDEDMDVYIFVPGSWILVKKEWMYFDPILCCHISSDEISFRGRQKFLAEKGYQIKTGIRGR